LMIERIIENPLTLKRYRRFKSLKRSVWATWIFVLLLFVSATAEFWANSKPILMVHSGEIYFPVLKFYPPEKFGQLGVVTDYRTVVTATGDWSIWPPVKWDPLESNRALESYPSGPSKDNLLGTDDRGRDVLARLI